MDSATIRLVRWVIARERSTVVMLVRARLPRSNPTVAVLREMVARRPFRPLHAGKPWITGTGAAARRCMAFFAPILEARPVLVDKRFWSLSGLAKLPRIYRFFRWMLKRHGPNTALRATRAVLELQNARALLRQVRPSHYVTHNDYSEFSLAFALACEEAGVPILLYQPGKMCKQLPMHRISIAAIYQGTDPEPYRSRLLEGGKIIVRQPEIKPMRAAIPDLARIGIVLNNYFSVDGVSTVVNTLFERFNPKRVLLRQHPNSRHLLRDDRLIICDPQEPLGEFASQCDVVIAGNTSAQLEVIQSGVPVVHVGELDDHPYDFYALVADGVVYGAHKLDDVHIQSVLEFYMSPNWKVPD